MGVFLADKFIFPSDTWVKPQGELGVHTPHHPVLPQVDDAGPPGGGGGSPCFAACKCWSYPTSKVQRHFLFTKFQVFGIEFQRVIMSVVDMN